MTHAEETHGGHSPHLAHHFDTPEQQLESSKLGMWIFLATEVLFFGGLFCGYAVYRAKHPEIFLYAHQFLSIKLGGINTVILLCSSFTMAWAVRASQLGQKRALVWLLSLTMLGGFGFMGIKYVEYEEKWRHGLLWGKKYVAQQHDTGHGEEVTTGPAPVVGAQPSGSSPAEPAPAETGTAATETTETAAVSGPVIERSLIRPSPEGPAGTVTGNEETLHVVPENVHQFFGIYFVMTGLHGIHVLVGIAVIGWLVVRSARGDFSPAYYTPVDLVGLYWHLVDLIWIFLFPLLYLIH